MRMAAKDKILPLLVGVIFFIDGLVAWPYFDLTNGPQVTELKENAEEESYRLDSNIKPLLYDIKIEPLLDNPNPNIAFTFKGTLTMTFRLNENITTSQIVLHAKNLDIEPSNIFVTNQLRVIQEIETITLLPNPRDFLTINFTGILDFTSTYTLTVKDYSGKISTDMSGFYRSSYVENGETKWLGTTQFQPTHARQVFPCLDEPGYKAKFKVHINHPKGLKALSNTGIETSKPTTATFVEDTFYTTPVMSTYLLAFIVSEFEAANETDSNNTRPFGVWARPDSKDQGEYPFITGQNLVAEMDNYTQISYYNMSDKMKMDQAAIPDFSAGAMENWGLLTYREAYLMYDEKKTSVKYRQRINSVLAHEIAHMWFGDLVTCHWWSDTWLNEGFARFFEHALPDMVENLDMATQFPLNQIQTAFLVDTTVKATPLSNPKVNTPDDVENSFGTITYNKGASVLRMVQNWIGEDVFMAGLRNYLKDHAYGVVTPDDLYIALQQSADAANLNGVNIKEVMPVWIEKSGYPLVTVDIDYDSGSMKVSQSRFVKEGETDVDDVLYPIPISYATKSKADFNNTKPDFILMGKNYTQKITPGHNWLVLNKKQTGYYRVNYDHHTWMMLTATLKSDARKEIHTLNRAQIVDDVINLARENVIKYNVSFDILQFLEQETDFAPWTSAISGFTALRGLFKPIPSLSTKLDKHITNLMNTVVNTIGATENSTDSHLTKLFRLNLMNFACSLAHKTCVDASVSLFNKMMNNGEEVNPNLREVVYCNGLRFGNNTHYEQLWKRYLNENVVNEEIVILGALGCTKDETKIEEFLGEIFSLTSKIRSQDLMSAFISALSSNYENVEVVLDYVLKSISVIKKKTELSPILLNLSNRLDAAQFKKFNAFLTANPDLLTPSEMNTVMTGAVNVVNNQDWAIRRGKELEEWIDLKYRHNSAGVFKSSLSFICTMTTLLLYINKQ